LLAEAAHGNVMRGPKLNDLKPVRLMLASGIDIELIKTAIRKEHDRRNRPNAPPLADWHSLMKPVAEMYGRHVLAKKLVAKWQERLSDAASNTDQSPTLRRAVAAVVAADAAPAPGLDDKTAGPEERSSSNMTPPEADDGPSSAERLLRHFGRTPDGEALPAAEDPMAAGRVAIVAGFRRHKAL
jgi:hypothetical protein